MMECSFEEKIEYPDGSYRHSTCINNAEIMTIKDPCFGLCYTCAYKKLQANNKKLQSKIDLALKELAHIEGEKNPTEKRVYEALKKPYYFLDLDM